jgi:homocitrate synthase
VSIGHRLTGWNAVKSRVEQLGLELTDEEIKDATAKIKELADVRTQSMDDVDSLLRVYHSGIQSGVLEVGQKEALDRLLQEHRAAQLAAAWMGAVGLVLNIALNDEKLVFGQHLCLQIFV